MNPDFASAVIHQLHSQRLHPDALTEDQLRNLVFNTIDACACGGALRLLSRAVVCEACKKRSSLRARSALRGLRLSFRIVVRAIWHVRLAWNAISAHAFARRYRLRIATAWKLLHAVRATIPRIVLDGKTCASQVLGRRSSNNFAVAVAGLSGSDVQVHTDEHAQAFGHADPQTAFVFGHLRALLVHVHCGVTARYLDNYVAEWSARRALGAAYAAP